MAARSLRLIPTMLVAASGSSCPAAVRFPRTDRLRHPPALAGALRLERLRGGASKDKDEVQPASGKAGEETETWAVNKLTNKTVMASGLSSASSPVWFVCLEHVCYLAALLYVSCSAADSASKSQGNEQRL
jgi:hypothetical protein